VAAEVRKCTGRVSTGCVPYEGCPVPGCFILSPEARFDARGAGDGAELRSTT
jgi:hypothetical protein